MHNVCTRTLLKINYCKIHSNFEDAEKFSQPYLQPCTILSLQQWKLRTTFHFFATYNREPKSGRFPKAREVCTYDERVCVPTHA